MAGQDMKSKTLYLHIGRPKTGTTSIQKFLNESRSKLESLGILYPLAGLLDDAHHLLPVSLLGKIPPAIQHLPRLDHNVLFQSLLHEIEASGSCKVIISSEFFSLLTFKTEDENRRRLAEYLSGFNTKIVIYFRHQPDFLLSSYMQEVKNLRLERRKEFSEFKDMFLKRKIDDYWWSVSNWADCFGLENILVRPFEREQLINGDVVADFLNVTECEEVSVGYKRYNDERNENVSPSAYRIHLLNEIAGLLPGVRKRTRLYHHIMNMPVLAFESNLLCFLSRDEYMQMARMYEVGNKKLAEMIGGPDLFFRPARYDERYSPYQGMDARYLESFDLYFSEKDPLLYKEIMVSDSVIPDHLEQVFGYRFGNMAAPRLFSIAWARSRIREVLPRRMTS
jgi:hypothetical protein